MFQKSFIIVNGFVNLSNEISEVDGQPIHEWTQEVIDQCGSIEKVKKLGLPTLLERHAEARKALTDFAKASKDWPFPVDFNSYRPQFLDLVEKLEKCSKDLQRHTRAIASALAEHIKSNGEQVRFWRSQRDRIRDYLRSIGLSLGVAKVYADLVYGLFPLLPMWASASRTHIRCLTRQPSGRRRFGCRLS